MLCYSVSHNIVGMKRLLSKPARKGELSRPEILKVILRKVESYSGANFVEKEVVAAAINAARRKYSTVPSAKLAIQAGRAVIDAAYE